MIRSNSADARFDEAGVALTPGVDFDRTRGARHVRLSFAGSPESVREGLERLSSWLKRGI
jgi:aspartate/methionine/tyrosine aminotransferase